MRNRAGRVLGILWIVALSIPSAWANDTESLSGDEWSFTVSPYVWGISLEGNASTLPPLPSVELDASFGDIVKDINLGFMSTAELRKGKFGIFADVVWSDLTTDPAPFLRINSTSVMATIAGAYRVLEQERGWLDLIVGARGWYIDTGLNVGPLGGLIGHSEGWVDAIGGLRTRINLGKGFHATAFTLGGGGASKYVVDLTGTLGYTFTNHLSTFVGYRFVKVNYEENNFLWDMQYQGPILGGGYKF